MRAEVERVFADGLAEAGRDATAAVELALSFEAWDQLRSAQGVSAIRAAATVSRMVTALLDPRLARASPARRPARDGG